MSKLAYLNRSAKVAVIVVPIITGIATSLAAAQAKPDDPSGWGKGASENAQTNNGNGETVKSEIESLGGRGFSGARHDDGEVDTHPTPPSGVDVPAGN